MRIARARSGLWVDTPARLTADECRWLLEHQIVGVLRYIARWPTDPDSTSSPISGDWFFVLSRAEVAVILDSGLQLGIVQAAKSTGRPHLSLEYGRDLGAAAAENCRRLALAPGATVWWDAEWTDGPSASQVLAAGRGWAQPVSARGDRPGVYVGYDGVDGHGWFSLPIYHYWGSAMSVQSPQPTPEQVARGLGPRGWQLRQSLEVRLPVPGRPGGLDVDFDVASYDDRGDRFRCISK